MYFNSSDQKNLFELALDRRDTQYTPLDSLKILGFPIHTKSSFLNSCLSSICCPIIEKLSCFSSKICRKVIQAKVIDDSAPVLSNLSSRISLVFKVNQGLPLDEVEDLATSAARLRNYDTEKKASFFDYFITAKTRCGIDDSEDFAVAFVKGCAKYYLIENPSIFGSDQGLIARIKEGFIEEFNGINLSKDRLLSIFEETISSQI
ncbi:MAG: hypothetical protein EBZ47_06915 [Chlamydiae bacterium]|nr:hypothetical protein [Chlamydiota bacterium]